MEDMFVRIEKELEKTLIRIARKVYKEMQIPAIIKKFIKIKVNTKDICLSIYYNNEYVAYMNLWDDYKNYYSIKYLADQLKEKLVSYASLKALKKLEEKL